MKLEEDDFMNDVDSENVDKVYFKGIIDSSGSASCNKVKTTLKSST